MKESETEAFLASGVAAKTAANRTARSVEAVRRLNLKRGVRVLENAEKNRIGDDDRRAERSLSLRMCVAFDALASSRTLAIFCISRFSSSFSVSIAISDLSATLSLSPFSSTFSLCVPPLLMHQICH